MDWYKILQPLPRQVEGRNEIYGGLSSTSFPKHPAGKLPDIMVGDIASAKEPEQRKDRLKLPMAGLTQFSVAVSY